MGDRPVRRPLSLVTRVVVGLALLALGGVVAMVVLALHAQWWGLALGVGATGAALAALPSRWWARLPFGVGWALVVVVTAGGRSEGDYVLSSDVAGYVVLVAAPVVLVVGLTSLRPHAGPQRGDSGRQPPSS